MLETNLVLTQNTQADLTHHLLNVHLLIVRIVDLSKPTLHLKCRSWPYARTQGIGIIPGRWLRFEAGRV